MGRSRTQLKEDWIWGLQELGSDVRHDASWLRDLEQIMNVCYVFSSVLQEGWSMSLFHAFSILKCE